MWRSEIWRRHAETAGNPAKKMMYRMEFKKMMRYERAAVCNFQHVIAVSENDRALMTKWVDGDRVTVVPTGVDLAQYRPAPEMGPRLAPTERPRTGGTVSDATAPLVTFVGAMDWEPNVDGVEYFCSEVWPAIKAEVPQARLRVVGRNPDRRVQKWASNDSRLKLPDACPPWSSISIRSSVCHRSFAHGGGTRLKIYEAMATAKAVVSTTSGRRKIQIFITVAISFWQTTRVPSPRR